VVCRTGDKCDQSRFSSSEVLLSEFLVDKYERTLCGHGLLSDAGHARYHGPIIVNVQDSTVEKCKAVGKMRVCSTNHKSSVCGTKMLAFLTP